MKTCIKCREAKGLAAFGKRGRSKDGYDYYCLQCKRSMDAIYRERNRDKVRESNRLSLAKISLEVKRARHKQWRDANKEHVQAQTRQSMARQYAADPEKFRQRSHSWYSLNSERSNAKTKAYAAKLADCYVAAKLGVSVRLLPADLIALKREQITINRLTKQLKQEITNQLEKRNGN